ncbi:wd repeat-containing protein hypothetical protein [Limosa lapponica baueri]|uniref:Uncharacterized protein n=1 Tax=Limosa lapponica baueri TaxID=1758121 RepID=A0A2I0TN20_LIMLA|nr:wd repeat-containing protein hypothetical protein [Limosa lapponica baueri]
MKLTDNVLRSFRVAKVFRENSDKINCFDFSPNGETVISSSDDDSIVLYDCQEGNSSLPGKVAGSEDGKIHVWNGESGMKVAVLDGKHTGPITCLQFNPKFMTFASACSNMAFWLPTIDD